MPWYEHQAFRPMASLCDQEQAVVTTRAHLDGEVLVLECHRDARRHLARLLADAALTSHHTKGHALCGHCRRARGPQRHTLGEAAVRGGRRRTGLHVNHPPTRRSVPASGLCAAVSSTPPLVSLALAYATLPAPGQEQRARLALARMAPNALNSTGYPKAAEAIQPQCGAPDRK
jgi:hypothetical protein